MGFPVLPGPLHEAVQGPQQTGDAPRRTVGQHLRHRQELCLLEVFCPPLGAGVKEAHGVQLIPEELTADGPVAGGGEKVQNAAPEGKLAYPLHLLTADIAGGSQSPGQLL